MKYSKILLCVMTLFCLAFQANAELESTNDTDLNMSNESGEVEFAEAYVINIEEKTLENNYFREVLYTGLYSQLVVMSIAPGEDIGKETHLAVDQFIRVESGTGKAILNGTEYDIANGSAIVIPAGMIHNIINPSDSEPLKLYTIYSPPNHPPGTINVDKAAALAHENYEVDEEANETNEEANEEANED